jgi:hypothetical protein
MESTTNKDTPKETEKTETQEPTKIEDNNNNTNKDTNNSKKEKIKLPKRKFAIIHGYNGHDFCGNQK